MRWLRLDACSVDLSTGALGDGRAGRLTTRERDLLQFLAERPGQDVPREELLTRVFGYVPTAQSRAVDKTMTNLRAKVEAASDAPRHLVTVQGVGYKFVPLDDAPLQERPPAARPLLPRSRLPAEHDVFVGRDEDLAQLVEQLSSPALVTLKGAGGVGKTRLALRAAHEHARAGQPAFFCELASARGPDDVVRALADALDLHLSPGDDLSRIGAALDGRGSSLLVLDGFEHLLPHVGQVARLRELAPSARLLVTSRVATRLPGERIWPLEPLRHEAAVELLSIRAAAQGFSVARDGDLDALVSDLDGLPLAVELAAARLGILTPRELTRRLRERLEVLRRADPASSPRHTSLRSAMDGSWELLDGPEQTALAQLSVFRGGFDLDAAEAVLSPPTDGRSILELITALERASLVRRRASDGLLRLSLLETIRAYAEEKLVALGDAADEARLSHAAHFAERGRAEVLAALDGHRAVEVARGLEPELDNLVGACRNMIACGHAALAVPTAEAAAAILKRSGPNRPLIGELCRGVLALGLPVGVRCRIRLHLGAAGVELEDAAGVLEEAIREAEEAGDGLVLGESWCELGMLRTRQGQQREARECIERGLVHLDAHPERAAVHRVSLAIVAQWEGRHRDVLAEVGPVEVGARRRGDRVVAARACMVATASAQALGDSGRAEALCREALRLFEDVGHVNGAVRAEAVLARIIARQGRAEEAEARFSALVERCVVAGYRQTTAECLVQLAEIRGQLGRLGEAEATADEALRRAEASGSPHLLVDALAIRGRVLVRLGRAEEAIPVLERSIEIARAHHNPNEPFLRSDLAWAHCGAGRVEVAGALLDGLEAAGIVARNPLLAREVERIRGLIDEGARRAD